MATPNCKGLGLGLGLRVQALGFRVYGLGFRVEGFSHVGPRSG